MMRYFITLILSLWGIMAAAQTITTPPSGSKPYGAPVATPSGGILVGRTGSYTYVAPKKYVDSLLALGYSKPQVDSAIMANLDGYVPVTRTINGYALSADVTLSAGDVGALATTGGALTGPLAMGNNRITGLAEPTAGGDAANKTYVDDAIQEAISDLPGGFRVGNSAGADQFTVGINDQIRFQGGGGTNVSFSSATNSVVISSSGSGGGNQTLSTNEYSSGISISDGNTVILRGVAGGNGVTGTAADFITNSISTHTLTSFYNTTGSTLFPNAIGHGIWKKRAAGGRGFGFWQGNVDTDNLVYMATGRQDGTISAWEPVATRNWASANFVTTNTSQTGLTGDKSTSGVWSFSGNNATPLSIARNTAQNVSIAYQTTGGTVYAGNGTGSSFAIAPNANLGATGATPWAFFEADGLRLSNGNNPTFVNAGSLAIKGTGSSPYISFHTAAGERRGYVQSHATEGLRLSSEGLGIKLLDLSGTGTQYVVAASDGTLSRVNLPQFLPSGSVTADLNSAPVDFYYTTVSNTTANLPFSNAGGFISLASPSGQYGTQILGSRDGNNLGFRSVNANTYSPWRSIWHSGNFNPATHTYTWSQLSGGNTSLIPGGGANNHGSLNISGSANSYAGLEFANVSGRTRLMMHTNNEAIGFYTSSPSNRWIWRINSNGVLMDGIVPWANLANVPSYVPTARTVSAGNGLTGGGALSANVSLAVGAGDGITVNSTNVAVNSTVARRNAANSFTGANSFTQPVTVPNATANAHAVNLGQIRAMFPNISDYTYMVTQSKSGEISANTQPYVGTIYNGTTGNYVWAYTGINNLASVGQTVVVEGAVKIPGLRSRNFQLYAATTAGTQTLVNDVIGEQQSWEHHIRIKITFIRTSSTQISATVERSYNSGAYDGNSWNQNRMDTYTFTHTSGASVPVYMRFTSIVVPTVYTLGPVTATVKNPTIYEPNTQ